MKLENIIQPFSGDRCLLCGGRPYCVALFAPVNSQLWGAAEGKTRILRYCLCERCKSKADTPGRVEKALWAEMAGGITHAE